MTSYGLTTTPCPVDVPSRFPSLAGTARETVRLHPRPGAPDARGSSLGGPLLWPTDERWPTCDSPWCTLDDAAAIYGRCHADAPPESVPKPCTVAPERVVEYSSEELGREQVQELSEHADALKAETRWDVWSDLLVAPGTKLGGHPS